MAALHQRSNLTGRWLHWIETQEAVLPLPARPVGLYEEREAVLADDATWMLGNIEAQTLVTSGPTTS